MFHKVMFSVSALTVLYCLLVTLCLGKVNFNFILFFFAGVLALLGFVDMKYGEIPLIFTLKKVFIIGVIVFLAVFVVLEAFVISGVVEKDRSKPDYTIVLGAAIKKDKPSLTLRNRLDAFIECNQGEPVIVTGGQGIDEIMPEAVVMENYLKEHGIENIIIEDKSENTKENLLFSKELIIKDSGKDLSELKIKIISSDYHCFRAKMLAKRLGYENVTTFGGDTHLLLVPSFYIREGLALAKSFIFDRR